MSTNKPFSRILILGNGGSGKSTLARNLHQILSIPILHLDKIYWSDAMWKIKNPLFDEAVMKFMENEKWIIEGTPMKNVHQRITQADTIIFMDYNRIKCIYRILKRRFLSLFNTYVHDDGCPAVKLSFKTFRWIWRFGKEKRNILLSEIKNRKNLTSIFFVTGKIDLQNLLNMARRLNV